jgi:hypothetical protein
MLFHSFSLILCHRRIGAGRARHEEIAIEKPDVSLPRLTRERRDDIAVSRDISAGEPAAVLAYDINVVQIAAVGVDGFFHPYSVKIAAEVKLSRSAGIDPHFRAIPAGRAFGRTFPSHVFDGRPEVRTAILVRLSGEAKEENGEGNGSGSDKCFHRETGYTPVLVSKKR